MPWYRKPLVTSAFYTDLTSGALHAVTFSIVVALWTFVTVRALPSWPHPPPGQL